MKKINWKVVATDVLTILFTYLAVTNNLWWILVTILLIFFCETGGLYDADDSE